jgi:hypothetical protein
MLNLKYGNLKHYYRHCFLRLLKVKGKPKNCSAALCLTVTEYIKVYRNKKFNKTKAQLLWNL